MFVKYNCDFFSETTGSKWRINILKRTGAGTSQPFDCTSEGFVLSMDGKDDDLLAPIKTSSVTFNMVVPVGSDNESIFDDLNSQATGNEDEFVVAIYRYFDGDWRRYWFGVMLGDLAEIADTSPNRIVKIKAVDGLTKLKYKQLDLGINGYGGNRSIINIIKVCLSQIPTAHDDFGLFNTGSSTTKHFIAHTPYYYCKGMDSGTFNLNTTWLNNVDHDPLALNKINMGIFQDRNGKPWSYYKILEQVLAAMHLRIMMTPFKNDSASAGQFGVKGDCIWFVQAPHVFHSDSWDSDYDPTQRLFYHDKAITTADSDAAISYVTNYRNDITPETRTAGGIETFIPPLLSYKTIYSHNQFNAVATSLDQFHTIQHENQTTLSFNTDTTFGGLGFDLTGMENIPANGWVEPTNRTGRQRILISGEVIIYPIDLAYAQSGGVLGYVSAEEFFNDWWETNSLSFLGIYEVNDEDFWVYPRMGCKVYTISERIDASGESESAHQIARYWLYQSQFINLFGSVPWDNVNGQAYDTDQYPNNYKGADNTDAGMRFNLSNGIDPSSNNTIYQNSEDVAIWSNWWDDTVGWWKGTENNDTGVGDAVDNHWAYFSPFFYNSSLTCLNLGTTFNSPTNDNWAAGTQLMDGLEVITQPFAIMSDRIPWNRKYISENNENYGWSYVSQVQLYWGFRRDQVEDKDGNKHYVCCKDWNRNHREYSKNRGFHWGYSLNNVKVYVVGISAGADSYDASYGIWVNDAGAPSEEDVQSPEILIGDEPQYNPFASSDELEAFGGDYVGQFKIYDTANGIGTPNSAQVDKWVTIHELPSALYPKYLHNQRAYQGVANRYQTKRKLDLKLVDTTTNNEVEMGMFGQIYYWNSGDWATNQSGADIAFMPSGGQFVAGTGRISLTMQDCITYSKDNLTDKSYNSNG